MNFTGKYYADYNIAATKPTFMQMTFSIARIIVFFFFLNLLLPLNII